MFIKRIAVGAVLSFALVAQVSPAMAGPVHHVDPNISVSAPKPKHTNTDQLSAREKQQINWSTTLIHKSLVSGHTLDFRKANAADGGHTTSRRQSLAGWLYAGGKITHMSSAEHKKTLSYIHKGNAYASLPHTQTGKVICSGSDAIVNYAKHWYGPPNSRWYFNSCRTAKILWTMDTVIIVSGAVAAFAAVSENLVLAAWSAIIGVIVGAAEQYIKWQYNESAIPAIWVRNHYGLLSVGPQ